MRRKALVGALVLGLWPMHAEAVTRDDFLARTTEDLITLCSTPEDDPLHGAALGFCHGYLLGSYQYYQELSRSGAQDPFVCLPNPPPSRVEGVRQFVTWAQAHPQYSAELPINTWFKFLTETWPCRR